MGNRVYTPKISAKGLMTLPKEVRNILGVKEGDRVLLKVERDGRVLLEKASVIPVRKGEA